MIILTWGSLEADGVDLGKLSETEAAALATAAERSVHVFTEQYYPPNFLIRFTGTFYAKIFLLNIFFSTFNG